jgi:hypothetical protein
MRAMGDVFATLDAGVLEVAVLFISESVIEQPLRELRAGSPLPWNLSVRLR